jgi:hypothetical protein
MRRYIKELPFARLTNIYPSNKMLMDNWRGTIYAARPGTRGPALSERSESKCWDIPWNLASEELRETFFQILRLRVIGLPGRQYQL